MPSVLNGSEAANNNQFFSNLVSGVNLDQYTQSVFQSAECSGCMYEVCCIVSGTYLTLPQMYKAGLVPVDAIRYDPTDISAFTPHPRSAARL